MHNEEHNKQKKVVTNTTQRFINPCCFRQGRKNCDSLKNDSQNKKNCEVKA